MEARCESCGVGEMKAYSRQLMRCRRQVDDHTTYYMEKCGVMSRISKEDYWKYWDEADGVSCLHTVNTKTHCQHYTTVTYYYGEHK